MSTCQCKCKVCHAMFTAKVADRKRGWAKCCSKSCAAKRRERKTGAYVEHQRTKEFGGRDDDPRSTIHPFSEEAFQP